MTTADNWTTDDIRRDRSVTQSENRHTDHKLELQVATNYMNMHSVSEVHRKEIANIMNNGRNLESRGVVANREKGEATTTLLRNNFNPTNDTQRKALEKNWEGLKALQPEIKNASEPVKEFFSSMKNELKNAVRREKSRGQRREETKMASQFPTIVDLTSSVSHIFPMGPMGSMDDFLTKNTFGPIKTIQKKSPFLSLSTSLQRSIGFTTPLVPKVKIARANVPKVKAPKKVSIPKIKIPKIKAPKVSMPKIKSAPKIRNAQIGRVLGRRR